jgi:hypothetical protein
MQTCGGLTSGEVGSVVGPAPLVTLRSTGEELPTSNANGSKLGSETDGYARDEVGWMRGESRFAMTPAPPPLGRP